MGGISDCNDATADANPGEMEAAVAYSEGLIHLDRKEMLRARESFQEALAQAPHMEDAKDALASMDL